MELKGSMLHGKKSEGETQTLYEFTHMWNLKNNENEQTEQNKTNSLIQRTDCQLDKGVRGSL